MRAQLREWIIQARKGLRVPNLIFLFGFAFFVIYAFVLTQGSTPTEIITYKLPSMGIEGRVQAQQYTCAEMLDIARSAVDKGNINEVLRVKNLCKAYVCGVVKDDFSHPEAIDVYAAVTNKCGISYAEGFEALQSSCSKYCEKGILNVRQISNTIAVYMGRIFGQPDYCVFLKKGPMMSALIPRCTDITYDNKNGKFCAKGFTCYIQGTDNPADYYECACDRVFRFPLRSVLDKYGITPEIAGYDVTYNALKTLLENMGVNIADLGIKSSDIIYVNQVCGGQAFEYEGDFGIWMGEVAFPRDTADLDWNIFINNKFPRPVCVIFFGLMPFGVIYFLITDLLFMVPLGDQVKQVAAAIIALFSLIFGTFDNMVLMISKLAGWSLGWSFLILLFGTAFFSAVMKIIMQNMVVQKRVNEELIEYAAAQAELMAAADKSE